MSKDQNISEKSQISQQRKKIPDSYLWAAVFTAAIVIWMLSGQLQALIFSPGDQEAVAAKVADSAASDKKEADASGKKTPQNKKAKKLFAVEIKTFKSEKRRANLVIRGRTEVDARVDVKAETTGIVEHVSSKKGQWVKKGELLCRIETAEREAALLQAKANLAKAKADYHAATVLARKGHTAQLRLTSLKAQLDAAKAQLKRAELDIQRTMIKAPFDGFVEAEPAKAGDLLSIGGACATLVSLHPLIVTGTVSELEVVRLNVGMGANIKFASNKVKNGNIRFISSTADQNTRTFRIEIEIENKDANLREGLSADISIPLQLTKAHRFSPAILVLNDNGQIGVRTVNAEGIVVFAPVKILSDSREGIWVAGLPDSVKVITVGQEYVVQGQKVRVMETKDKTVAAGQGS